MASGSSLGKLGASITGSAKPSSSSPLLKLGQFLTGVVSTYTVTKQLGEFVWLGSDKIGQTVLIKSARHFRIGNERDILKKFQPRTSSLRPLVDEIVEPADPPAIILKHLEDDLLHASNTRKLTPREIKYVSKRVLEGLKVLHEEGYVHTDVKIDNVLVNHSAEESDQRFTDVQLCDFESTVHTESPFCKNRDEIGTPIWRSPEAQLGLQWGPPTDIWSFGAVLISLIWGDNFFIFKPPPDIPRGHGDYVLKILQKYHIFFGPYPESFADLCDHETAEILNYVMRVVTSEQLKPFTLASQREISREDREFVLKIMKIDPRDRPTAKELLEDEWFKET